MTENDSIPQHFMDSINHIEVGLSKEIALGTRRKKEFPSLVVDKHDFLIMHSYFPQLKRAQNYSTRTAGSICF